MWRSRSLPPAPLPYLSTVARDLFRPDPEGGCGGDNPLHLLVRSELGGHAVLREVRITGLTLAPLSLTPPRSFPPPLKMRLERPLLLALRPSICISNSVFIRLQGVSGGRAGREARRRTSRPRAQSPPRPLWRSPSSSPAEGGRKVRGRREGGGEPRRDTSRASWSPLHLLTRVEAEMLKKVVRHSVATALASIVFPVPGGPWRRIPRHGLTTQELRRVRGRRGRH
jgi:hypothetical protein